jgi:DNA-binding transcriptional MerR regulator
MLEAKNNDELPPIPGKRYFTIGEVSDLCGVKPHVLRYWEQEFPQLKPVKRRGNRRYYQRQDVLVIRQIRSLLYEAGLHHRWRPQQAHRRGSPHGRQPEPADRQAASHRARRRAAHPAPLSVAHAPSRRPGDL